jgi:hypothetical protein
MGCVPVTDPAPANRSGRLCDQGFSNGSISAESDHGFAGDRVQLVPNRAR